MDFIPKIGEKSKKYPFGFGYCQCGCGTRAPKLSKGGFARYRQDHHPMEIERRRNSSRYENVVNKSSRKLRPLDECYQRNSPNDVNREHRGRKQRVEAAPFRQEENPLLERYLSLTQENTRLQYCENTLKSELEFTIKYIQQFWTATDAQKALLKRLKETLKNLNAP